MFKERYLHQSFEILFFIIATVTSTIGAVKPQFSFICMAMSVAIGLIYLGNSITNAEFNPNKSQAINIVPIKLAGENFTSPSQSIDEDQRFIRLGGISQNFKRRLAFALLYISLYTIFYKLGNGDYISLISAIITGGIIIYSHTKRMLLVPLIFNLTLALFRINDLYSLSIFILFPLPLFLIFLSNIDSKKLNIKIRKIISPEYLILIGMGVVINSILPKDLQWHPKLPTFWTTKIYSQIPNSSIASTVSLDSKLSEIEQFIKKQELDISNFPTRLHSGRDFQRLRTNASLASRSATQLRESIMNVSLDGNDLSEKDYRRMLNNIQNLGTMAEELQLEMDQTQPAIDSTSKEDKLLNQVNNELSKSPIRHTQNDRHIINQIERVKNELKEIKKRKIEKKKSNKYFPQKITVLKSIFLIVLAFFLLPFFRQKKTKNGPLNASLSREMIRVLWKKWDAILKSKVSPTQKAMDLYNLWRDLCSPIEFHEEEAPPDRIMAKLLSQKYPKLQTQFTHVNQVFVECYYGKYEINEKSLRAFTKSLLSITKPYVRR